MSSLSFVVDQSVVGDLPINQRGRIPRYNIHARTHSWTSS